MDKQQSDDLYKQVNCTTLSPDMKVQELNLANYNYYISDGDSVGDHIYEVIDDCYEVIRAPPGAPGNCSCSGETGDLRQTGNGNVYIRKPEHFSNTNYPIVTIRFDRLDWQEQCDSHQRHFNSLKAVKTQRKFR